MISEDTRERIMLESPKNTCGVECVRMSLNYGADNPIDHAVANFFVFMETNHSLAFFFLDFPIAVISATRAFMNLGDTVCFSVRSLAMFISAVFSASPNHL